MDAFIFDCLKSDWTCIYEKHSHQEGYVTDQWILPIVILELDSYFSWKQ